MKIDPYNHKRKYLDWRNKVGDRIPNISKENSDLIFAYLKDMEIGANVAAKSVKGARSFNRLNNLRNKMSFFCKQFEKRYGLKDLTKIKENQLVTFFADMKNGTIKRQDGNPYNSVDTFGKGFKAFWHWHQKVNRKKGIEIPDITKPSQ